MAKYTALLSRGMSKVEGKANVFPLGDLIQLLPGDKKDDWSTMTEMKEIFYWKSVELTGEQVASIKKDLASPIWDIALESIVYPAKRVSINAFSVLERSVLARRGEVPVKLGGNLEHIHFNSVFK